MESDFIFLTSCKLSPRVTKSSTYILSLIFLISSKYMLLYLSKCVFTVTFKINGEWFNPDTRLVKRRIWIVLFVRFSIQWNFKNSLSFFDGDLRKRSFNVSAQNYWSKSKFCFNQNVPLFVLKGWLLFRQSLREYTNSDLVEASSTTLNFVDFVLYLISGLCGTKNSLAFSLFHHVLY